MRCLYRNHPRTRSRRALLYRQYILELVDGQLRRAAVEEAAVATSMDFQELAAAHGWLSGLRLQTLALCRNTICPLLRTLELVAPCRCWSVKLDRELGYQE
jgi:hypothetical protein